MISIMIGMNSFEVSANKKPYECHGELVSYILPGFSEKESNVTRSEFVMNLINLRYGEKENRITTFKDVDEFNEASGEIDYAKELGIIENVNMFYPDLPITVTQAKKVAVNLLGYKKMAELKTKAANLCS